MRTTRISPNNAKTTANGWVTAVEPAVRPQFSCPSCGSAELKLTVTLVGTVTYRFAADGSSQLIQADEFASEFPTLGDCSCPLCGWTGLSVEAANDADHEISTDTPHRPFRR